MWLWLCSAVLQAGLSIVVFVNYALYVLKVSSLAAQTLQLSSCKLMPC